MSNIVNATAFGTDTGTGQTFDAYDMTGPKARFREVSPSAQAGFVQLSRVEPKPTSDYAGAMRGNYTFRREYADANGRLWPAVYKEETSLPAFLTDAVRTAFVTEAKLIGRKSVVLDAESKLIIPQS